MIFNAYAPKTTNITPIIPVIDGSSSTIMGEVKRRNAGVNERKGTVNDKGDILSAFIYNIIATNSRGRDRINT